MASVASARTGPRRLGLDGDDPGWELAALGLLVGTGCLLVALVGPLVGWLMGG